MNAKAMALMTLSIALLAVSGCKRQAAPPPRAAPEVAVIEVKPERVVVTTELPGRTAPRLVAEIRPQVSGIIQKRLFEEGADVEAGQLLYQIDSAMFQATLNSAKASLARAEAAAHAIKLRAGRLAELIAEKAVSQQDYDDAKAAALQADAEILHWKSAVETAQINLDYTGVKAPISGRIGKSSVTDGALATAFQPVPLAVIQQIDPIYVDVPQSATELLRLKRMLSDGRLDEAGDVRRAVKLILADGSPYELEGELQFQDITVNPTTGTVGLRAVFPNPDNALLPGMFVRAVIVEGAFENGILVPQQAVTRNPKGDPFVMVVDANETVQLQPVTIDRAIDNNWLVTSGLNSGDRVIMDGVQRVRPGVPARAVPFEAKTDKPAN